MSIELFNFIIAIIAYGLGFLSGYLVRGMLQKFNTEDSSHLILIVVSVIWAISVIVDIANPAYDTPTLLHGLMGAIVGYYYKNKYDDTHSQTQK